MSNWPVRDIKRAIGARNMDFLTVANAWASYTIVRENDGDEYEGPACVYTVDGRGFPTLHAALDYVTTELGEYQAGRAD